MKKIMKLNKIFTIATLAASALFATSCSDDVAEYAGPGTWDADANYANVYFPVTSKSEMVDPTAETVSTVTVARRNVSAAATIPVKVIENEGNVFSVSDAVFAAGDTTTTVTISYPTAEIGTPYKLVIGFEGSDKVSSYSKNVAFTYTVQRVKWNSLGEGKFTDNWYFEMSWPVEILQRDDDKSYYRIVDPYGPTEGPNRSEYVELHVMKKGDVINGVTLSQAGVVDWYRINTGYVNSNYGEEVWALHPKNFTSKDPELCYNSYVSGLLDNGNPGQFTLSCMYYMFGVGGWDATTDKAIIINLPGFVEEYTAALADYDWEPVFTGEYNSEQLGTKKDGVTLYKGVPNDSIEQANPGCYERFVAKNGGSPYIIASPYASGNNLIFLVKNSNILPLVDGDDDYTYQYTGMNALNQKVYANILASSKYADDLISLDIQFQTLPNKAGEFTDYGTSTETLANITWTRVGTGTFSYNGWWDSGEQDEEGNYLPLVDPGYELFLRDGSEDTYKITDWGAGVDYVFTWNKTTNVCATQLGFIGESHPSYGEVYVVDASNYSTKYAYADYPSQYVPEENTFYFFNAYVVSAGSFGVFLETFQVDWDAAPAAARKASAKKSTRVASLKLNKNIKAANRFVGKRAKADKFGKRLGAPQMAFDLVAE